jgi:hypothetical protein
MFIRKPKKLSDPLMKLVCPANRNRWKQQFPEENFSTSGAKHLDSK